ncbi:type VI secretion system Vgr family protein [Mucilaginibacter sp.]|uniref:type VI secretion system Vgr family protein n=1 Tax=Mucilaginibacter sp. TaxID=1882438 RepID=UPI0035BBC1AC
MENKVITNIYIEGTVISHFSSLGIMQRFNEHHSFELRFNYDQMENFGTLSLDNSKGYIGKNITIEFGIIPGQEQVFTGKITRVEFIHTNGYHGELVIAGYSPGILLERGPDLGSYLGKNLQTIVEQATEDAPSNDLKMRIKPVYTDAIDYIIQYKESDFGFLNRLSAEYHEWFYYDGTNLNFGKPDKLKEVSLIYGRNLQTMQYGLQVAPLKYSKFAYDPKQDELLTAEPSASGTSPDLSHAIDASNHIFSKLYNQPVGVRVNSKKEIDYFVDNEQKAVVSELIRLNGSGDEPQVSLGSIVNISTSLRGITDFEQHDFGKFLVTSVYHQIDGVGHYHNTFEAVAADTERLPVKVVQKPLPDMQLATVIDNNDPQGQGRIKVQFKWKCTSNDPTEWLRIVSPTAGNDDQGQNNRGFIAIPEINDQVLIGFEEGNIARPVVMGSVYHSNNGDSQQQVNNHLKSIATRSGHLISFDDSTETQGILVTDRKNNVIRIDTNGDNIIITANNDVTITAGNNVNVTAAESMTLTARNLDIIVEENMSVQVGKESTQSVGQDYSLIAANISKTATGNITSQSETHSQQASKEVTVNSTEGNINHHAKKEVKSNSGEKSLLF